jgi:hypothetical protein
LDLLAIYLRGYFPQRLNLKAPVSEAEPGPAAGFNLKTGQHVFWHRRECRARIHQSVQGYTFTVRTGEGYRMKEGTHGTIIPCLRAGISGN